MDRPVEAPTVFLDACVLYPALVRGILLRLAEAAAFRPAWSPRVLAEWRIAATRDGGISAEDTVADAAARMATTFPDASVTPDPVVEQSIALTDPADTHVLAGAIAAGAEILLTFNLRDFPVRRLAAHGIVSRHPDGYLWELFSECPTVVDGVLRETTGEIGLTNPDTIRRALKRARLPRLAKAWFGSVGVE